MSYHRLTWTESISDVSQIESYLIYRALQGGEFSLLATVEMERDEFGGITTEREYLDEAITPGETYEYYIVARSLQAGDSAPSNTITLPLSGGQLVTEGGDGLITEGGDALVVE